MQPDHGPHSTTGFAKNRSSLDFSQSSCPWPLVYSGLEIPHLYMEQLIAHVHMILSYGPVKEDATGYLIHTTGEAMQVEVGYSGELLAAPLSLADNITNSWTKQKNELWFYVLSNSPPWLSLRVPLFQSYTDSHNNVHNDIYHHLVGWASTMVLPL